MNKILILSSIVALSAAATPALAQNASDFSPTTFYGNAGYSGYSLDFGAGDRATLAALGGRLGARFGKYVGVEGEAGFGVNTAHPLGVDVKVSSAYAGYVVGYIPATPKFDIIARVGYGRENVDVGPFRVGNDTVNFGVGGQYFFTAKDGVRAEYTRMQHATDNDGDADTWSIVYVRKF